MAALAAELREARLVAAALSLRETPFRHQGRQPGVGIDCIGAMVVTAQRAGALIEDRLVYRRNPNPHELVREVEAQLDPVVRDERRFGDVGLCWLNPALAGRPHHCFLLVPGPRGDEWMVHAWMEAGRVAYNPYASPWTDTTYGFYRFRWQR